MSESPFPRLDLAPKLDRPLRLSRLPDYLRLLYWVFFFPQAILCYVKQFGNPDYQQQRGLLAIWQALRGNTILRRLVIQAFLCLLLLPPGIDWLLQVAGVFIDWRWVAGSMLFGVLLSMFFSVQAGVTVNVAPGVAGSVVFGVAIGVMFGVAGGVVGGVAGGVVGGAVGGVVGGVLFGAAFGTAFGAVGGMEGGVRDSLLLVMVTGVLLGGVSGVAFGVAFGAAFGVTLGVTFGVTFGVAFGVTFGRLPDWLLLGLSTRLKGKIGSGRVVWLPLPGVSRDLEARLSQHWIRGIQDINQVLAYTSQFIPAVQAVSRALAASPESTLLERTAVLADNPYDWNLVRYGSADLANRAWQEAIRGILFLPGRWSRRWQARFPADPRLDTPARAACAGFWFWHNGKAGRAADTFAVVRELRHGQELYGIARAIASAQSTGDLDTIMAFWPVSDWLEALPDPELRPGTLRALRVLRQVADEARLARHSVSVLSRSAALGRANAGLTLLLETGGKTCLQPEWPLIRAIAEKWRDIISKAGGIVGEEVLRQPVPNPYEGYSGMPVTGPTFVGRENILRYIEDRWAGGALILFGHRRMGKTSILRNLNRIAGTKSIVVYLDMQDSGWVDHTGQLLLDFAEAIHRRTTEAGLDAGQPPVEVNYANLGTARRSFNALLDRLDGQMAGRRLILAVDEYEVIDAGIAKGRIDSDMPLYLRSTAAKYRWLALIFAGLHTLDEMGHDYRSAFYGQAEYISVGYLSHDSAIRLITQPYPDFALEYSPELREELYHLTYGQPYLLQRICWELVTRWNERFLREDEFIPRAFAMEDLASVLTPDFYQAAGYYFDGLWSNITNAEQQLLRILAGRAEGGWTTDELAAATGQTDSAVQTALDLLHRHDMIVDEVGGVRFAVELMRRWVAEYGVEP